MKTMWKVVVDNIECQDRLFDTGELLCLNEFSKSQYCQEETCPRRIDEENKPDNKQVQ